MEEEKKKKVRKPKEEIPTNEQLETYNFDRFDSVPVESPAQTVFKKKMAYKVVLVSPSKVVYDVGNGNLSFTANIWGKNLKKGDEITLEK